jgi:hypothetical protein
MKIIFKSLLIITISFTFWSCKNYDDDISSLNNFTPNDLFGVWTDTLKSGTTGKTVNMLTFNPNGSFVAGTNTYGIYGGQKSNDLSGYFEYYGNYVLSIKNIYFKSQQSISWDSFAGGNPVKTQKDQVIFESCTYKISSDTLNISYITYPADAPVVTKRQYKRIEKFQ